MKRPRAIASAAVLAAFLAAGCSSATAVKNARSSYEKAKTAGAEAKAPYEYYSAEAYLGLAQHEAQEGDHKAASGFAETSERFSAEALQKAGGGAK